MSTPAQNNMALRRLDVLRSALLVCDLQKGFANNISHFPEIVSNTQRLIKASTTLQIPIIATEQNPSRLQPTVDELGLKELNVQAHPKMRFSMYIDPVRKELEQKKIKDILLVGIETQACIFQSCIDFLEAGLNTYVVVDAVSSRTPTDRIVALQALRSAGIPLITTETAILLLLGGADHPKFKEVAKLIREPSADTGLLSHLTI